MNKLLQKLRFKFDLATINIIALNGGVKDLNKLHKKIETILKELEKELNNK